MLNQIELSGDRQTLIPDIQGSTVASLASASGSLVKTGYRAFGQSASTSGSYRYTGRRIDAETNGLYYYRARMYSPALGRFLQPDPIGYEGGQNLYAYVGNDPLNGIDPLGLATKTFQLGVEVTQYLGGMLRGGFYYTDKNKYGFPDFGVMTTYGRTFGGAYGATLTYGKDSRNLPEFKGPTTTIAGSILIFGGSGSFDKNGNYTGWSAGLSTKGGALSISHPTTKTFGLMEDIFIPVIEAFGRAITGSGGSSGGGDNFPGYSSGGGYGGGGGGWYYSDSGGNGGNLGGYSSGGGYGGGGGGGWGYSSGSGGDLGGYYSLGGGYGGSGDWGEK